MDPLHEAVSSVLVRETISTDDGIDVTVENTDFSYRASRAALQEVAYFRGLLCGGFHISETVILPAGIFTKHSASIVLAHIDGEDWETTLAGAFSIFLAADFLQLETLQTQAVSYIERVNHGFICYCRTCADSIVRTLTLAHEYGLKGLVHKCVRLLGSNASLAWLFRREIIELDDQLLRAIVTCMTRYVSTTGLVDFFFQCLRLQASVMDSVRVTDWEDKLVSPLLDGCAKKLASKFSRREVLEKVQVYANGGQDMDSLLRHVVRQLNTENVREVYRGSHAIKVDANTKTIILIPLRSWLMTNWMEVDWSQWPPKEVSVIEKVLKLHQGTLTERPSD